jgi:CheY-like chemotaxis protein
MKILLVDNDVVYANLLGEILTLYSHTVLWAADGEAALEILKSEYVDLVISDALMPRMNGLELHQNVRQDERFKHTPFAWNSGHKDILGVLRIQDPEADFVFDKAGALSAFLHFVNSLDVAIRMKHTRTPAGAAASDALQE